MKKLSEIQESLLREISSKWMDSALRKKPLNKSLIQDSIVWLYQCYSLPMPEIHDAASPLAAQEIARDIRARSQTWRNLKHIVLGGIENHLFELPDINSKLRYRIMGGAKAASIAKINIESKVLKHFNWYCEEFGQDLRNVQWCSFYDFCCQAGFVKNPLGTFDRYCEYVFHSGVFLTIYENSHVIVCPNPSEIKINTVRKVNSLDGHEVSWSDGFVTHLPYDSLAPVISSMSSDVQENFSNVPRKDVFEVTPEFLRRLELHPIVHGLRIRTIDKLNNQWGPYELLRVLTPKKAEYCYLKMLNPSTGKWHFEVVPNVRTCKQALAWRDGESRYSVPNVLT
jgi:hypothetical protein